MKTKPILLIFCCLLTLMCGESKKKTAEAPTLNELFLLLPDNALPKHLTVQQRQELLDKGEIDLDDEAEEKYYLVEEGVDQQEEGVEPNALAISDGAMEWATLYFWTLSDDTQLVTILSHINYRYDLQAFFYEEGQLTPQPDFYSFTKQSYRAEDFVNTRTISPRLLGVIKELFNKEEYHEFIKYEVSLTPEKNVVVEVTLETFHLKASDEYNQPDTECKLRFERIGGQWESSRLPLNNS